MEKEIKSLIKKYKNDLYTWEQRRHDLRTKIKFCTEHNFNEEIRISLVTLNAIEPIIYDYNEFIEHLEKIINCKKQL